MNEINSKIIAPKKPLSRQEIISAGFSFCVISGGKRAKKIEKLIASIRSQNLPTYEIIIAGELSPVVEGINYIALPLEARAGKTSVMRNRAMQSARYKTIVMCDDDIVFDEGFAEAIANFGREFDVLCVAMRNPDGSRLWDWATVGGPSGHRLLDYNEVDDFVYVSSGVFAISKEALQKYGFFNENLAYYQAEDVEFSQRLKAQGARIDICKQAGALHDDPRYTQFDDYPRRIYDFNKWEKIAPCVESRGLYVWDGKAFPMSQEVHLKLINNEPADKSFCFTSVSLPADQYSVSWKCTISADGLPFAELTESAPVAWSLIVPANTTRLISLKSNDVVVPFSKGAFRDQRAVAAYLLKPEIRDPQPGDISLSAAGQRLNFSEIDRAGLAVFAPCMAFGEFAASSRALLRNLEENNIPFGLELHSVDHWFSQLCFNFPSAAVRWTNYLKKRKYCGINLVVADADTAPQGFFKRARISRPGFNLHYVVTSSTESSEVLEDLKSYDNVYVFDQKEAAQLARHGIYASVLDVGSYFPKAEDATVLKLPNQRSQAATIIVDESSYVESALSQLTSKYGPQEDISIVVYVVGGLETVGKTARRVEDHYRVHGQQDRIAQTIVSAGSLEAIEELEFLRLCRERINLLKAPISHWLDQRLGTVLV